MLVQKTMENTCPSLRWINKSEQCKCENVLYSWYNNLNILDPYTRQKYQIDKKENMQWTRRKDILILFCLMKFLSYLLKA